MKFSAHKNRFTFAILSERPCMLNVPGGYGDIPGGYAYVLVGYGQSPPGIQQVVGKDLLKDKLNAPHP